MLFFKQIMIHKKHIQRIVPFLFAILFVYSCIQDDYRVTQIRKSKHI